MKVYAIVLVLYGNLVITSGHPSDPCIGTICGKGAQCRMVSNLVVCICPEDSVGDPFVECRPLTTTVGPDPPPVPSDLTTTTVIVLPQAESSSSSPVVEQNHVPPQIILEPVKLEMADNNGPAHDGHMTQDLNPSPMPDPPQRDSEDAYFPSAPPTLSHYAHSHYVHHHHLSSGPIQFNPNHPTQSPTTVEPPSQYHQQLNQLYANSRTRPRPHQQHSHPAHNVVNQEQNGNNNYVHPQTVQQHPYPGHPNPIPYPQNTEFDLHQNNGHPLYRNTEHRHNNPNTHFSNHHHLHHNSFHAPPHPHHYPSPNFNLKPEAHPSQHAQKVHHDAVVGGGMEKDPLGKYENCRTINNIIVCADTSSDAELHHRRVHPHPVSEQRYPAHSHGHGPAFNNFNNNENKPNQFPLFNPQQHHNPNFNEKHPHPITGSGTSNNYHGIPASKTEFGQDHYQPSARPGPIIPVEDNKQFSNEQNKPIEPLPGTNDFALCKKMCGEGSVCRVLMGRPICGCPAHHSGDPAVKCYLEQNTKYDPNACQRHADCSSSQFCLKSQCTDPCLVKSLDTPNISSFHYSLDTVGNNGSMCGVNAICTVIEHNALCSCEPNHFGNPYVGCVV